MLSPSAGHTDTLFCIKGVSVDDFVIDNYIATEPQGSKIEGDRSTGPKWLYSADIRTMMPMVTQPVSRKQHLLILRHTAAHN